MKPDENLMKIPSNRCIKNCTTPRSQTGNRNIGHWLDVDSNNVGVEKIENNSVVCFNVTHGNIFFTLTFSFFFCHKCVWEVGNVQPVLTFARYWNKCIHNLNI